MRLKKDLLIALIAFLISSPIRSIAQPTGNPIQDAPTLASYVRALTTDQATATQNILKLLSQYAGHSISTKAAVDSLIQGNNFLTTLSTLTIAADARDLFDVIPSSVTATGEQLNLSANNIAGAIGTFIANRFKQEIEIAFIQSFKDWINSKKTVIIGALLPETKKVLATYDPYQYTTFLQALREAFTKDVSNLPPDLQKYLADPSADPTILGAVSQKPYYYPAVYILKLILEIRNLSSIINEIDSWDGSTDPLIVNMPHGIKEYMTTLSILSKTLTDPSNIVPDSPSSFRYLPLVLVKTALLPANINYFLGLFLLKNKAGLQAITFKKADTTQIALYNVINNMDQRKLTTLSSWFNLEYTCLTSLAGSFGKITTAITTSKPVNSADEYACVDSVAGAVQHILAFPFADLNITIDSALLADARTAASLVQLSGELYLDFQDKSYGLVITHIIDILKTADIVHANSNTLTLIERYGNFAVSVVNAKTQQDVVAALETAALPVGSYAVKRNSLFSVELNAYAGVFGGAQTYSQSNLPPGVRMTTAVGGITAPVGINLGWGAKGGNGKFKGYSNSLFIPVIDVGAIAAFKLQSDNTSTLPNFTWNNILAPGIYYVHGIKNNVLSYGIGGQYGPELRSISGSSATVTPAAWSIHFFIAADIPFFNFYSKADRSPNQ